jgi:hypothetical protein
MLGCLFSRVGAMRRRGLDLALVSSVEAGGIRLTQQ